MALSDWEPRPPDNDYYAERTSYVRMGDIFQDVPLGYPWPPDAVDHDAGTRKFLSGPFEPGFGMLLSPTCSMVAQGAEGYPHPVRMLAPVLPLAELVERQAVKEQAVADVRVYDHLVNYFYLPAIESVGMPESLALLYTSITIHLMVTRWGDVRTGVARSGQRRESGNDRRSRASLKVGPTRLQMMVQNATMALCLVSATPLG